MNDDLCSLLKFLITKTRERKIFWIYRPGDRGGIAYGLSGKLKFVSIDNTYYLFYYRVGKHPDTYYLTKENAGWFLACQLYRQIVAAKVD